MSHTKEVFLVKDNCKFLMGHLVVRYVSSLALPTPLTCSTALRFAMFALLFSLCYDCFVCSLAPFSGSFTHFAHSLEDSEIHRYVFML